MIEQYDNTKSYDSREKMPIFNPIGGSYGVFPVTDKCERSATLMGDDYVKLAFEADERVLFEAFSFIVYDGKHYFLKEKYRPTPKGTYYDYAMTFVSAANMLSKSVFMRYYQVSGQTIQPEPEVNVNANLSDMVAMVVRSIVGASSRVPKFNNTSGVATTTVYANMIAALTLSTEDLFDGSELKTFSFESSNIEDVLTQIANDYDTEWWLTETNGALKLHVCKCEEMVSGDGGGLVPATPSVLSDTFKYEDGKAVPYSSRGLLSVAYAQEWSNIPQRILPFGSDRNIVRKQAVDNLNDKEVYVSYGKRLRLTPGHTYTVKNKAGEDVSLVVGSYGEVTNESVTTGIEKTEVFDDIYPQGHYIVTKCELSSNGNYYTIEAQAVVQNADGTPQKEGNFYKLYSVQEANTPIGQTVVVDGVTKNGLGLVPILNKEQTEDLTIRFESGFLNGREFGVSRNNGEMVEIDGVLYAKLSLDIVPDGNDDEALSLPNETWHPQARTGVAEGDMFAIFNMDMPEAYVTMAEQRLAQAVYDKLQEYQASRPDVKCKSEPTYFEGQPTIKLGKRYSVFSELFGEVVYIDGDPDKGIDETQSTVFTSRVTAYSHSLTTPTTLEFTLASGRVAGRLADIEAMISDSSTELRGLEQRHINLSKRGWHDAYEITQMVDSLTTESMLVGNAKYQFQYTFGIVLDNSQIINSRKRTASVTLTGGGCIQHTQKPYIDYANQGIWYVDETEIDLYTSGGVANYDPTKAYYLYAKVNNTGSRLTNQDIVLTETAQNGDMYMLLGILSSEFEDTDAEGNPTSFRVFSRMNGYSQINGGTITTEQIQDANRQLIIDFQHNPPRIVAVNGAEIIGNIRFRSLLTEDGQDAGEEIFKEIGGENLCNIDGKFVDSFDGTQGYYFGDSLPLLECTGVNSSGVKTYAQLPAGKYVLTYKYASIKQNRDDTGAAVPMVSSSLTVEDENGTIIADLLGNDRKIVFELSTPATLYLCYSGRAYRSYPTASTVSVSVDELMIQKGTKQTQYQNYYKYLATAFENAARAGTTDIDGGLLMTSLLKLRNLAGDITAGMSGLTEDAQGNEEPILMWGGANYQQALEAALPKSGQTLPDYKYTDGGVQKLINTLLRKDGLGKIGIFYINDNNVEINVPGQGKIVLDASNTDGRGIRIYDSTNQEIITITPRQISDIWQKISAKKTGYIHLNDGQYEDGMGGYYGMREDIWRTSGSSYQTLDLSKQNAKIHVKLSSNLSSMSTSVYTGSSWQSSGATLYIKILITSSTGTVYGSKVIKTLTQTRHVNQYGVPYYDVDVTNMVVEDDLNLNNVSGRSQCIAKIQVYTESNTERINASYNGSLSKEFDLELTSDFIDKKLVVAKDGIAAVYSDNNAFFVQATNSGQKIFATGLPSSNPGNSGQLYATSDGILRVSAG